MGTIAVTGAGSGIGAATPARLRSGGHTVIGVDLRNADVDADLGTPEGRQVAIDAITERSGGVLHGLVPCAGISGLPGRPASLLVSVNYFGTVRLLEALRPLLVAGAPSAAVAISSNSTTCQPGYSMELVEACLADDEEAARALADTADSVLAYPATKLAVARWVRTRAVTPEWAGSGVNLNAIAPGMIMTPMVQEGYDDPAIRQGMEQFAASIPLGHAGRPEDIAGLLDFLLGPDARFFCGSVILCDGGTEATFRPLDWPTRWEIPGL